MAFGRDFALQESEWGTQALSKAWAGFQSGLLALDEQFKGIPRAVVLGGREGCSDLGLSLLCLLLPGWAQMDHLSLLCFAFPPQKWE